MRFTKMHGAGNDYVNCFAEPVPADISSTAIAISDRHTESAPTALWG